MMKIIIISILSALIFSAYAKATNDNSVADVPVLWTAVFSNIRPVTTAKVDEDYCIAHTPTTLITTYQQINSKKGVTTLNGLNIRYLNYKTEYKNDLYFYVVNGILSGKDEQGKWHEPITLYEQTLDGTSTIWAIWSTTKCKGIFIANPTFPDKAAQANLKYIFSAIAKNSQ